MNENKMKINEKKLIKKRNPPENPRGNERI
jgi:hypothetical protein